VGVDKTSSPRRSALDSRKISIGMDDLGPDTHFFAFRGTHRLVLANFKIVKETKKNIEQNRLKNTKKRINSPTPITVAFNSGGGICSNTPIRVSPKVNKLANSTARC